MKRILFAGFFICAFAIAALAQSTSGVTGVVTDAQGGRVVGATVTLTDTKTSKDWTTTTDDSGVYRFVSIPPGDGYKLSFTNPGFQTLVLSNLTLGVNNVETHNAELPAGNVAETVEVVDQGGATLNTTDARIGNVIEERRLRDLPIQIRSSPASLLGLQAGVVGNNVGTGTSNRVGSVTGSRADQGNITIDGIDANDQTTGQAFATVGNAPIDAIQEFRAVTTNPNAAEGRSSGGQIELVTKSGTNEFHGSLYEYNRTAKTAANSFFNNRAGRFANGTPISPRPQLTRNQFGGAIGGPVLKDKLFFFFNLEARRDAQGVTYTRTVPLQHVRNGSVAFLNNVAGCPTNARLTTRPECITILTPGQVAAIDPQGIGADASLLAFINSRYPLPNDLTLGNGINTGGFRFNSPSKRKDETYVTRIDWNATERQKVFGRFNIARRLQTDTVNTVAQQFPGDPETGTIGIEDFAWVVGHTWTPNSSVVNNATVGVTRQGAIFDRPFAPAFPNIFTFGPLTAPFAGISTQDRFVAVPTIRDDLTWTKGDHYLSFGGQYKPIRQETGLVNDFNFVTVGLGGLNTALANSVRPGGTNIGTAACTNNPACIQNNATSRSVWDSPFAFILGRIASIGTNFNYDPSGNAFAPGTGKTRDWRYNELEFYAQDNWRARNDLTVTYGVRWHYYPAPYEANGFQACQDVDWRNLFDIRSQNAARGIASESSEPFFRYDLCGKKNGTRAMYEPDLNNFGPRLSFAWNPSFKDGILGTLFGERKTVIRGGGSMVYDRVGGALTFIQDQVSYLFDNSITTNFGEANARNALLNDPRFNTINNLPFNNTAPVITRPLTPFVDGGFPTGGFGGETNYAIDQNFRIPYSIQYSLGFQRELPGNFLLDMSYVGRQGRKLFTQADAAQILDFKDNASGQFMIDAFNRMQLQLENDTAVQIGNRIEVTPQPWFENQVSSGVANAWGLTCPQLSQLFGVNGVPNCSSMIATFFSGIVEIGDTADTVQAMFANGMLNPNVGLSSQFSTNAINTNLGSSSYNGMLVSLRKRFSQGLQFDVNYTFSHSIDNQSSIVNTVFGGLVCDIRNLRICRGNSDFDIRHLVNANFIYELPFGRGKMFGSGVPGWANQIIGGWETTGIFTYRSGLPFNTTVTSSGTFPVGFVFSSPAQIVGSIDALRPSIHDAPNGTVQFFADPVAAAAALRYPRHGEIGNRNVLRSSGFWNTDIAVLKNFTLPWEGKRIQIRWEMYNAFNHHVYGLPAVAFTGANPTSAFGQVTGSASTAREMQFAFRFEF